MNFFTLLLTFGAFYQAALGWHIIWEFVGACFEELNEESDLVHPADYELQFRDRMSIREIYSTAKTLLEKQSKVMSISSIETPSKRRLTVDEMPVMVCDATIKEKVKDSISRALNFYDIHIDELDSFNHAVGLSFLKATGKMKENKFVASSQLEKWILQISELNIKQDSSSRRTTLNQEFLRVLESRPENVKWLTSEQIETYLNSLPSIVGNDKETISMLLYHDCVEALVVHCEVPQVCRREMFNSEPATQYMLTAQIMNRILAEQTECLPEFDKNQLISHDVSTHLFAKMLLETELINQIEMESPVAITLFRDILAHHVAYSGYAGYPNLLTTENLSTILSWQSESPNGCFLEMEKGVKFFTSSLPSFERKLTESETQAGIEMSSESCSPGLTSASLAALSMYLDYIETNCGN